MSKVARMRGHRVRILKSLNEAWSALKRARAGERGYDGPHHVVSELTLDDGDGEEWIHAVRDAFPQATVICLSAHASDELTAKLLRRRILHSQKPCSLRELFELIG